MPTIAFHTLGCRLNQYETEAVVGQFRALGYRVVQKADEADLQLIDTCSVTDRADQKARQAIRAAVKGNPESVIVVTGCYTQTAASEIAGIPGVDFVLGNREKQDLPAQIPELAKQDSPVVRVSRPGGREDREYLEVADFEKRTRATLKIQDGCDVFCTYCIVPFTRGRSRSLLPEDILRQARHLADLGYREIVLTGVHIGDYGQDIGGSLPSLLRQLLSVEGLQRIRISSIEPWDISRALVELIEQEEKVCAHLHAPIQSASDHVLSLMRRRIDRGGLERLFDRLAAIDGLGLGTDLIVGFPGESEEDFEQTKAFIAGRPFSRLHVFPYSERRGTRATSFAGAVPPAERKRRCRELIRLGEEKMAAFHRKHEGLEARVLVEERQIGEHVYGYTDNYIRVELPSGVAAAGELRRVRLHSPEEALMSGKFLE